MFVFVPRRCERGLKVRQFGAKIRKKPQTLRAPGANIATRYAKYTQMGAFCNLERRDRAKIAKSQPGRRAGAWGGRCGACKASPTRGEAAAEPAKPRRRAGKPLQNLQSPADARRSRCRTCKARRRAGRHLHSPKPPAAPSATETGARTPAGWRTGELRPILRRLTTDL